MFETFSRLADVAQPAFRVFFVFGTSFINDILTKGPMKRLFILLLLILAACETAVQTVPTSNYTPSVFEEADKPVDPCLNVHCTAGQHCLNGGCVCDTGKPCGDKCISAEACCTNDDCATQNCVNQTCAPAKECSLGEELVDGDCACTEDRVYCKEQNKCIKKGDCCYFGNCPSFQRCQKTTYRASVCLELGGKKLCKAFGEARNSDYFEIGNFTANAKAISWPSDRALKMTINGQNYTLTANQTTPFGEGRIYQEGVEVLGGKCEPDETE